MKNHLLSFLFIVISLRAGADQRQVDSLKTLIEHSADDTLKVKNLLELAKQYSFTTPTSAIHFTNLASKLAEKLNYLPGKVKAIKLTGNIYYSKGKHLEAITNWTEAMVIYDTLKDKAGISNMYSNIGAAYFEQGEDTRANEYYFNSLKTAEELHDTVRIASAFNNIAAVYQRKDKTQGKALEFYLKALPLAETVTDPALGSDLIRTTTVGLGELYMKRDSVHYKENPRALDTALYYTRRSLEYATGTTDEAYSLNQMGQIYRSMKQYDKAVAFQKKALAIAKNLEATNDVAITLKGLAKTYQMIGDKLKALETFQEAELTAKETGATYELKDIYEGQAQIYAQLRDYTNAYKYQYLLLGIKDTIYDIEQDKKLQGVQFAFDLEKKEGEINLLTKDKKIQDQELHRQMMVRNSFIGGFAVVLLFAGIFFSQRNKISKEKKRSDELLLNILPSETAEELKATGTAKTKSFEAVTVMFTDFKNFTQASELLTPEELVAEINTCYSEFDKIVTRYGIEKIKTIGDSYMCAGGLPVMNTTHPVDVVKAGLEMQQFIAKNKADRISKGQPYFELRLGIHTGPVVAGIVGTKKFAYDIWGDTVNTASRMESSGEVGKVNISGTTFEIIKDHFRCIHRGKVAAKNKGDIDMYFVESGAFSETFEHINAGLGVVMADGQSRN